MIKITSLAYQIRVRDLHFSVQFFVVRNAAALTRVKCNTDAKYLGPIF